jgi:hypothetical protein
MNAATEKSRPISASEKGVESSRGVPPGRQNAPYKLATIRDSLLGDTAGGRRAGLRASTCVHVSIGSSPRGTGAHSNSTMFCSRRGSDEDACAMGGIAAVEARVQTGRALKEGPAVNARLDGA